MQSKNAIGNLLNRFKAVLRKCALLNAGLLACAVLCGGVMGSGAGIACGATLQETLGATSDSYTLTGDVSIGAGNNDVYTDFTLTGELNDDSSPKWNITSGKYGGNTLIVISKYITLSLSNIEFKAIADGNIQNYGKLLVNNVSFTNCIPAMSCTKGSAITIGLGDNVSVTIKNSTFTENEATKGGAIATNVRYKEISNSTDGPNSILTIDNCTFENNTATEKDDGDYQSLGGAIFYVGSGMSVTNSEFSNNHAIQGVGNDDPAMGGAIANYNDRYYDSNVGAYVTVISTIELIENTTFQENKADDYGGAIGNNGYIQTINGNSKFISNEAQNGGAIANFYNLYYQYELGVAVLTTCAGKVDLIEDTNFEKNIASNNGGAIYNCYTYATLSGEKYEFIGVITTIKNCYFSNNVASNYGGAIYNAGMIGRIEDTSFTDNSATNYGGAIVNWKGEIGSIKNTSFFNNEAAYGGAICNVGSIGIISDGAFEGNEASSYGGAIYNDSDREIETIKDTSFTNNSATLGGAIYNSGTFTYVASANSNFIFSGNTATSKGGFLYAASGSSAIFDIAEDATLTIGAADKLNNTDDSIYTVSGSTFTKTGLGTLLVRSNFDNDGALIVNQGTMVIEGDVEAESAANDENSAAYWYQLALEVMKDNSFSSGSIFMLGTSFSIGDGLYVGGNASATVTNNTAYFDSGSILVVHVEGTSAQKGYIAETSQAALVGNGSSTLVVKAGAKIVIYGGGEGAIRIAEGFSYTTGIQAISTFAVTASADDADIMTIADDNSIDITGIDGWDYEGNNVLHINPLYSASVLGWRVEDDDTLSFYLYSVVDTAALGDLAQLASIAGVASNTASIATSAMDASGARFAIPDYDPELTRGFNLWAIPIFSMVYGDDFASTRDGASKTSSYHTAFGGLNIGADYTTHKDYRFGIGLHAGYGETASNGDYEHTENDFSFWGVTLYGGRMWNDFSIYADVNLSMTKSDLVQDNPKWKTASLSAETDAYAFTAEVRADYRIRTDYVDILPHVGARYMNVNINDYDVKLLGDTICSVETLDQNIWSFPVGVQFSHEWTFGEENTPDYAYEHGLISQEEYYALAEQDDVHIWTLKPRLDLGVIFATGDIDADSTAYMPDRSVSQNMTMQTFDRFAYSGNLGVDLRHGQSTFSLDYATRISEHLSVQDIFFTWRYEF